MTRYSLVELPEDYQFDSSTQYLCLKNGEFFVSYVGKSKSGDYYYVDDISRKRIFVIWELDTIFSISERKSNET